MQGMLLTVGREGAQLRAPSERLRTVRVKAQAARVRSGRLECRVDGTSVVVGGGVGGGMEVGGLGGRSEGGGREVGWQRHWLGWAGVGRAGHTHSGGFFPKFLKGTKSVRFSTTTKVNHNLRSNCILEMNDLLIIYR